MEVRRVLYAPLAPHTRLLRREQSTEQARQARDLWHATVLTRACSPLRDVKHCTAALTTTTIISVTLTSAVVAACIAIVLVATLAAASVAPQRLSVAATISPAIATASFTATIATACELGRAGVPRALWHGPLGMSAV